MLYGLINVKKNLSMGVERKNKKKTKKKLR